MNFGADILAVRTGRATVMIGLPASLAPAPGVGEPDDASQLIDLALAACGETHGLRQFCIRCGLPTHGLTHVGNRGLRNWLVNAVRQGRLAVMLLPDVIVGAGAVQARTLEVRTDLAMRIDRIMQAKTGARFRPLELIAAMPVEAEERRLGASPRAAPPAPAGARVAAGQGRDLTPSDVRAMALEDRILEIVRRMLAALEATADVRRQDVEALVAPGRLAGTVGVLTAWADTHVGDMRVLADLALRAFGQGGVDEETLAGLEALSQALAFTRDALDPDGLETAAHRLARALALLGPDLERLIASSTTLPVAVPSKPRAHRDGPPPASKPAERYWPRPAGASSPGPAPGPEFPSPSQQAKALRRAAARGSTGCKICAAR